MKLSVKARYGLKVMCILALEYGKGAIALSQIANDSGISEAYLEKVLMMLRRSDLVNSTRGASGGYELSKPPADTSVGEIVRALEDGLEIVECIGGKCADKCNCRTFSVWNKMYEAINNTLDNMSLESLISEDGK